MHPNSQITKDQYETKTLFENTLRTQVSRASVKDGSGVLLSQMSWASFVVDQRLTPLTLTVLLLTFMFSHAFLYIMQHLSIDFQHDSVVHCWLEVCMILVFFTAYILDGDIISWCWCHWHFIQMNHCTLEETFWPFEYGAEPYYISNWYWIEQYEKNSNTKFHFNKELMRVLIRKDCSGSFFSITSWIIHECMKSAPKFYTMANFCTVYI